MESCGICICLNTCHSELLLVYPSLILIARSVLSAIFCSRVTLLPAGFLAALDGNIQLLNIILN